MPQSTHHLGASPGNSSPPSVPHHGCGLHENAPRCLLKETLSSGVGWLGMGGKGLPMQRRERRSLRRRYGFCVFLCESSFEAHLSVVLSHCFRQMRRVKLECAKGQV